MGDFSANFHRPDSGINTVEGTKAGSRAAQLEKKRQREQEEFLQKKQELAARGSGATSVHGKFASSAGSQVEQYFQEKRVGLVTAAEFKQLAAQEREEKQKKKAFLDTSGDRDIDGEPAAKKKKTSKKPRKFLICRWKKCL